MTSPREHEHDWAETTAPGADYRCRVCGEWNETSGPDLADEIDSIISTAGDPEAFHAAEDRLMMRWIRDHADDDVRAEFERLWSDEFTRWYA